MGEPSPTMVGQLEFFTFVEKELRAKENAKKEAV